MHQNVLSISFLSFTALFYIIKLFNFSCLFIQIHQKWNILFQIIYSTDHCQFLTTLLVSSIFVLSTHFMLKVEYFLGKLRISANLNPKLQFQLTLSSVDDPVSSVYVLIFSACWFFCSFLSVEFPFFHPVFLDYQSVVQTLLNTHKSISEKLLFNNFYSKILLLNTVKNRRKVKR